MLSSYPNSNELLQTEVTPEQSSIPFNPHDFYMWPSSYDEEADYVSFKNFPKIQGAGV